MLTTAPRLRIRRPSPTTAEFSVTTLPPSTLPLRLLLLLLLLLRLLLTLATVLVLYALWVAHRARFPAASAPMCPPAPASLPASVLCALEAFQATRPGVLLARAAAAVPAPLLLPAAALGLYALSLRVHAEESLLVLRGLGVQTSEAPATYLARAATRFIPTEKIQDIFVNEAFRGFEVRYYLVVVVEGEEDVVVVFPGLLPRRRIVEAVWRGVRECLYEENKVHIQDSR
ncbi:Phosphatidylinositol N-acetylglucosaminyltransferase subunit gpi15 [Escovopsis weberi]|uniref:Phosphatidylinositol N-acetylglucosaminyltransferase subunit gpi15 n=1 Tax=Escovopsis weberi TaxID=150374 RepID=A0A0M8N7Y5_ESCWE|nr:Phosphatidylinositol N-acetylglucosaminyltransferase subunit gpi15 [Escovopsis weberi]